LFMLPAHPHWHSAPVRYMIFDEVSRFPVKSKGRVKEGDPLALGKVRQTTFGEDAKTVYVSSPVEAIL
jgi:phage terminase large subunit GpA-like protein